MGAFCALVAKLRKLTLTISRGPAPNGATGVIVMPSTPGDGLVIVVLQPVALEPQTTVGLSRRFGSYERLNCRDASFPRLLRSIGTDTFCPGETKLFTTVRTRGTAAWLSYAIKFAFDTFVVRLLIVRIIGSNTLTPLVGVTTKLPPEGRFANV